MDRFATKTRGKPRQTSWLHRVGAFACLSVAIVLTGCRGGEEVDFNADIRPVLNENCVACHGGVRRKADLSLLFREDALKPAKSGHPAIVPGDPGASELIRRVVDHNPDDRMPKEAEPLPDDVVDKLKRWIADGAEWAQHWAYVPPDRDVNAKTDGGIDRFVEQGLNEAGLSFSPEADCAVLVRRVSLDIVGLPASREDVQSVCGGGVDVDDVAYSAYVDTLLASPRYGERWAAMWLDLARYADSQGYEKDDPRSIWRYRDWLITAFNADMEFDAFTIAQIAGDLLPDAQVDDRLATAFQRNSMTNTEGGTDDEEHRVSAVVDRVNTTFEVWQGTSAGCAQCHGHPYDPMRHEEYFQLFAFFNNTSDWDQPDEAPVEYEFEAADSANALQLVSQLQTVLARIDALASTPELSVARAEWETQLQDPKVIGVIPNTWQNELLRVVKISEEERTPAQRAYARRMFVRARPEFESLRKDRDALRSKVKALKPVTTPVLVELPKAERRQTRLLERGNFLLPAQRVAPGVPAFLPPLAEASGEPTRLDLARWLVSPENPLTARVTVNRFWEQLFGIGIVETAEDFGTQGAPPSHPELLDWLAVEFSGDEPGQMDWSVKRLLRTIVLSTTYRQRSAVTPELLERDPRNRLLARGPRFRLTAEQVRDQALAVGGLLSGKMLGPSVMPPQPDGIWQNPYSGAAWVEATGEDRYRRGLYTFWRRTAPYPSMITFDSPSREYCVSRRIRTNTPLQALVTLNDPVFVEAAQGLAGRMFAVDGAPIVDRVALGYELAMGYPPDAEKLETLTDLYQDVVAREEMDGSDAMFVVSNAIMNTDEFLTKE